MGTVLPVLPADVQSPGQSASLLYTPRGNGSSKSVETCGHSQSQLSDFCLPWPVGTTGSSLPRAPLSPWTPGTVSSLVLSPGSATPQAPGSALLSSQASYCCPLVEAGLSDTRPSIYLWSEIGSFKEKPPVFFLYSLFHSIFHIWHLVTRSVGFPCQVILWISQKPAQCPTVNPDPVNLEKASEPAGSGLWPTRPPQVQTPNTSPGCHPCFWPATEWRFPWPPPWLWSFPKQLTEFRKMIHLPDCRFITKDIRGHQWIDRWRDTEGEVRKAPKKRSFCSHGVWGVPPSWHMDAFFFSLNYWFIIKGSNSGIGRWKRCVGQSMRGEHSFQGLLEPPLTQISTGSPPCKLCEPHAFGFYGGFLM